MALPRVNDTLNFNMKIPSTGKRVKYRPYLVKEEKVLLQAFESGDLKSCLEAIIDTLDACVHDKVDVSSLATFDVEYMFTQIRARSVGETSNVTVNCSSCNHANPYQVNIEELKVEVKDFDNIVKVTDDISVEIKYPTYEGLMRGDLEKLKEEDTDSVLQIIASSIGAVMTQDERIDCSSLKMEEVLDFLNSMTAPQLRLVSESLTTMPALEHNGEFDCEECGVKNEVNLKGLADFF